MMAQPLHAQLVMVRVLLVAVLQLPARPAPLVNSCPAQHALHAILDVAPVLEKEHAQSVMLTIT